jgi:predicted permease
VLGPCLLIKAFRIELTPERVRGYLFAVILAFLAHAGFLLIAVLLEHLGILGLVESLSIVFTNCGNLILPIVAMTMGEEMVFYASAYQLTYNLLFWTHGNSCMSGVRGVKWRKMLLNPNVIAIFAGMFLLVTGIRIPGILRTSMEMLEGMVGPCCMLVIGMTMAGSSLQEVLSFRKAWLVCFLRLLVLPMLAMAVLRLSGFLNRFPELVPVLRVSFLAAAAPPGANVAQTAVLYDREPVRAGVYNLMGMFFCMLTMPLIDYLYAVIF